MPRYRVKTSIVGVGFERHPEGFIPWDIILTDEDIAYYGWDEKNVRRLVDNGSLEEIDDNGNPVAGPVSHMVDLPRTSDNNDMPVTGRDPALQTSPVKPHLADVTDPMDLPSVAPVAEEPVVTEDDSDSPIRGKRVS